MNITVTETITSSDRLLLGEGLFETIAVSNGQPQHANLHWQRMKTSANALGIAFDLSLEAWLRVLGQWIEKHGEAQGGLKVILSGGDAERGLLSKGVQSHLLLQFFKVNQSKKPLQLMSSPWLRDANNPVYRHKTVNYLEAILARKQAMSQGADDVLFFNTAGLVTETSTANLFLIRDSRIYTPALSAGLLAGISRQRVLDFCLQAGIDFTEGAINRAELNEGEAVFLSSTLTGIGQVCAIDDRQYQINHPLIQKFQSVF